MGGEFSVSDGHPGFSFESFRICGKVTLSMGLRQSRLEATSLPDAVDGHRFGWGAQGVPRMDSLFNTEAYFVKG
jgi:hypothetical protein